MRLSRSSPPSLALVATARCVGARADTPPPQGVLSLDRERERRGHQGPARRHASPPPRKAPTPNAVQAQLKQALDAALAEAKKAARPGQVDVQTGNFSLFPRYTQQGRHHRLAGQRRAHRRRPRHGGDRPAHRPHHDDDDRRASPTACRARRAQKVEGEVAAEAIAALPRQGRRATPSSSATAATRARGQRHDERAAAGGRMPMMRAQASAMSAQGDALGRARQGRTSPPPSAARCR